MNMNPAPQRFGDRYGHGAPTQNNSNNNAPKPTGVNANRTPFSNPYEGHKVLMEGEEGHVVNEHNLYAKSQMTNFDTAPEEKKETDTMKWVIIGTALLLVAILAVAITSII